jgi:hypothetical protein
MVDSSWASDMAIPYSSERFYQRLSGFGCAESSAVRARAASRMWRGALLSQRFAAPSRGGIAGVGGGGRGDAMHHTARATSGPRLNTQF